jgi:hypothetical protein
MLFIFRCWGIKNQRPSFIQSFDVLELLNFESKLGLSISKVISTFGVVLFPQPSVPQLLILQSSTDIYWLMLFVHLFASPVETSHVKCCDYCHWQMLNNLLHVRRPQQKPCSYANTSRYLPDLWPMQRDRWRYLQNSKNPASYPQ